MSAGRPIDPLMQRWASEAALYRRRGQEAQAMMVESFMADLEGWWTAYLDETLTTAQAAAETGRSESTIRRWRREKQLPKKIRRRDLLELDNRPNPTGPSGPIGDMIDDIVARRLK